MNFLSTFIAGVVLAGLLGVVTMPTVMMMGFNAVSNIVAPPAVSQEHNNYTIGQVDSCYSVTAHQFDQPAATC